MTIEHFLPVSTAKTPAEVEALVNDYRNCFYACRYCNGARNVAPEVDWQGRKLLNPFSHAWGEHFMLSDDDRLLPLPGDLDAEYTAEVYDLNETRKLQMRRSRRERMDESLALIDQGPGILDALLASSMDMGPGARSAELLMAAESLRQAMLSAEQSLIRHAAIPEDADTECRCGHGNHLSLPSALEEQTMAIDFAE
jgi:hypothetical protein